MKSLSVKKASLLVIVFAMFTSTLSDCKKEDPAIKPVLSTSAVFNVAATTATSGGFISSDGGADVTSYGVCWGTNANPSTSDSKTSDGTGTGQFVSSMTGLTAGTTYHVRAYAINSVGTSFGADVTFSTLGQSPTGFTQPASNISLTSATLNGIINPNNLSTTVTFEYGLTTTYGQTVTATQSPVTSNNLTIVSIDISGLTQGTLYHFRVKTVNSIGTVYGTDLTFTTLGQTPAAITQPATNISTTTATFNGAVNPNSVSTTVTFDYGTSTNYGQSATATQSPVTGTSIINVSKDVTNLNPGTIYHYRIKTVNSLGTVYSGDMTFTTLGKAPTGVSQPATNISTTGATLNGMVNPNLVSTTVTFEYGTTISYGQTATAFQSPVIGDTLKNVNKDITGLSSGTTYYFRVKVANSFGTIYSGNMQFTTLGQIPAATTLPASNITSSGSILNGIVNANYLTTAVTFDYGLTTSYGQTVTASQSPLSSSNLTNISVSITGLLADTTYHFRVKAVNSTGTTYGTDLSFTTTPMAANTVSDVDGNIYNTVNIGTQIWMKENLKTTKYNDGSSIPLVPDTWQGMTTPAYCWQNNDESTNKPIYGAIYNWYTVNTGKLCPTGWHVPSDAEWTILTDFLGGVSVAGGKLKEAGTVHWTSPNTGATNESGFTGLPGGSRTGEFGYGLGFSNPGINGVWQSATIISGSTIWRRYLTNSNTVVIRDYSYKFDGLSVRCIKN
jgi:uncharacterized protein (TIGR02145 family)